MQIWCLHRPNSISAFSFASRSRRDRLGTRPADESVDAEAVCKSTIKREQNQAYLNYAEREQSRDFYAAKIRISGQNAKQITNYFKDHRMTDSVSYLKMITELSQSQERAHDVAFSLFESVALQCNPVRKSKFKGRNETRLREKLYLCIENYVTGGTRHAVTYLINKKRTRI